MKKFVLPLIMLFMAAKVWPGTEKVPKNMALILGGVYEMGDRKSSAELNVLDTLNPDRHALGPEDPAHIIEVNAFYIDVYEVTNEDYKKYVEAENVRKPALWKNNDFNGPRQPVVGVSWKEAKKYCQWRGKRLPTEAEWEKASRGKRHVTFPWGDTEPDDTRLNYDNHMGKTVPVGSYPSGKSDYGVHDLSGNVAEWIFDWHAAEYYLFSPEKNPKGPERGQYKVIRGGNWRNNRNDVRLTYRGATVPKLRTKTIGFRCVADLDAQVK